MNSNARMRLLVLALTIVLTPVTASAADSPAAGKPQYGTWGFAAAGQDKTIRPGDDFFRHANGHWLDTHQIPADKPAVSLRLEMTDRTEARLHEMMQQAAAKASHQPSDLDGKVGAFYKAFMDERRVDQVGAKPLAPELDAVRAAKDRDALAGLLGRNQSDFEGTLFNISTDVDLKDPKHYAVYLSQAGLGLPDRDYYLKPEFAAPRAKYQAYAARLLHLIGWPDADARAKDIVAFETQIAQASWTKAQQRDPIATYNPVSVAQLEKLAPGFAWKVFLTNADLAKMNRVIIAEKSAFPNLAAVYAKTSVETLKAWTVFHIADNAAPYLSKDFTDAYFEMRDKTLAGQQQQKVRWKRAVYAVSGGDFGVGDRFGTIGTLGFGVGQLYTAKYFPPEAKAKIEALVANLKAAYRARIEKLDWMGPATKKEALKKLDTYNIKVGYPDHPREYSKLIIADDDLVGDVRRAAAADWAFYTGRLFGPVDRTD
jgi:putative endopeptidase